MTPVTFYSKYAAAYAANAAYAADATYAANAAYAAYYAAYYAAFYAVYADIDAFYGVLRDLGVKYAGVLVQCQIIASYKGLL